MSSRVRVTTGRMSLYSGLDVVALILTEESMGALQPNNQMTAMMDPEHARAIAAKLIKCADEIEAEK